jgi:hypothetical protein
MQRIGRALKARHTLLYRTFGAHFVNKSVPGLTAGPIHWRPFGPIPIQTAEFRGSFWKPVPQVIGMNG